MSTNGKDITCRTRGYNISLLRCCGSHCGRKTTCCNGIINHLNGCFTGSITSSIREVDKQFLVYFCTNSVSLNYSRRNIVLCIESEQIQMTWDTNRGCQSYIKTLPVNTNLRCCNWLGCNDRCDVCSIILVKCFLLKSIRRLCNLTEVGVRVGDRNVTTTQSFKVLGKTNRETRNDLNNSIVTNLDVSGFVSCSINRTRVKVIDRSRIKGRWLGRKCRTLR